MSQRDRIQMTGDEVAAFLGAGRTVHTATLNPDGSVHLVPMWYAVIEGRIAFWTYASSQKALNLGRDPRITAMVEAGETYDDLRGVTISGRAEISNDEAVVQVVGEAVFTARHGTLTEDRRAGVAAQAAKRVAVLVTAERVASWDHRKL